MIKQPKLLKCGLTALVFFGTSIVYELLIRRKSFNNIDWISMLLGLTVYVVIVFCVELYRKNT